MKWLQYNLKKQNILLIYAITGYFALQKMMKECMVRLIYCEMLGYDASFGYIHAIKLAQQGNLLEKRVGMYVFKIFYLILSLKF